MTDWRRKHASDLANVCKELRDDSSLPVKHRQTFAEIYVSIRQLSSLPTGGEGQQVAVAVNAVCEACQIAFDQGCKGRIDWRQQCELVHKSGT